VERAPVRVTPTERWKCWRSAVPLPKPASAAISSMRSFLRLARRRRRAARARRLRGRPPDGDQLVYLALDTGWAAVAPRQRLGVQTITIESVVGTFDDHKAVAFDRCFRPPRWSRAAGR
jgi:hypothetical protein